jgi:hypothetical protein
MEEDKQSLDGAWFLSLDKKEDKQTHLDTTSKMHMKTKRLVITLKDTINMAISRPSLLICDKFDPSIIGWQRYGVYKHLKNSMLNVVKLSVLHVLVSKENG